MLSLVLLALAQAPTDVPVAIVISSRRDTVNAAPAVVEQLRAALQAQGITATGDADSAARLMKLGAVDPKACDGARLCLQKLAQLLQGVVIGVDVSRAGKLTAGHVEAVAYDRVESLAADDVTSDAKSWAQKASETAAAFAAKLKGPIVALVEARKPKVAPKVAENELKSGPVLEAPRVVAPEPPPAPPLNPNAVAVEPQPKSNLGPVAYVTTAAAIIGVGAGIVCLVLGFLDRGTYFAAQRSPQDMSGIASSLSDRDLQALASQSNVRIGLGGALLGIGAALALTAGILFAKE